LRDTFIEELSCLAQIDPKIVLITGDLGFGVFDDFRERFPKQFINAGVAEQNMTGVATGMAMEGWKVFTYSIANFPILRCLEQVRNDACYHEANVNIVAMGGGLSYGALGFSHHATEDLAIMRSLPNIDVIAPCDLWETAMATRAVVNRPRTSYLRLDKSYADTGQPPTEAFEIGKGRLLRQGSDVSLIVAGGIAAEALKAAEVLAAEGIECRVVSLHTIKPLDRALIVDCAKLTSGLITIEEHTVDGGLGGAVAECCLEAGVTTRFFFRIGLREGFSTKVGDQQYLRDEYDIGAAGIVEKTRELLKLQ